MSEIINPRVDLAFKKIFGVEENKDLLISLINAIVSEEDQVADLTLLNPYNLQNFKNDKLSILDIKAKSLDGKMFNIEIQIADEEDYDKRALYYWAKAYTEQLQKKDTYNLLSKAIGIHILNFTSIVGTEKYHNVFHIREKDTHLKYFKDLELHTIELNKFADESTRALPALVEKVKTALDMWAAFLTRHELLDKNHLPKNLDNNELRKALEVIEVMNFRKAERDEYEGHLKWLMIQTSALNKMKRESLEEGREEGREEGTHEKAIEIATNLLKSGMSIENISAITGLSQAQLRNIR